METESNNTRDINRLCEVLGIDPSAYISFGRRMAGAREPALVRSVFRSTEPSERDHCRTHNQERILPAAYATFDGISAERIGAGSPLGELVQRACPKVKPTQVAMLSIAGGTGKTLLAAMLGRVLAFRGHSVLLADHSPYNTIHDLFGMRKYPFTAVSFAHGNSDTSPLPVLSRFHDGDLLIDFEPWFPLIAARTNFTIIDGMTNVVTTGRELIASGARILVPVLPDLVSAMSAMRLDSALESPWPGRVNYILNRFDASQRMHIDVKAWLRDNLGARLLPFEIREDQAVRQVAAGSLLLNELPDHSSARHSMEFLADWLETSCVPGHAVEVSR